MTTEDNAARSEVADLRRRLRVDESALLDKYSNRIEAIEKGRPWFVVATVIGAALTGIGRLFPGTAGVIITCVGIVLALVFGALVGWADFRKLELSREARSAMSIADEALEKAGHYAAAVDREVRHRNLRDDRLEAGTLMREAIATGVANGLMMGDAIDAMLDSAKLRLVAACGFDAAEYWAITVFELSDDGEEMEKIAALWNDATTSAQSSRGWRRGEGFTGTAWRNESPIIVPDVLSGGVAELYAVPSNKHRNHDQLRYRSAASYPVVVDSAVWGVVTATSNVAGRFDRTSPDGIEACRTVQDIAGHTALLATVERYAVDAKD